MSEYTERIDADLEVLIPRFMENSQKEYREMLQTLEQSDFSTLRRLGHSCKGASLGYGFKTMGEIALAIEEAAKAEDADAAARQIERLGGYLDTVCVEFVEM